MSPRRCGLDPIAAIGRLARVNVYFRPKRPRTRQQPKPLAYWLLTSVLPPMKVYSRRCWLPAPCPARASRRLSPTWPSLWRTGFNITVVDADFQHPQLRDLVWPENGGGIVDALASEIVLNGICRMRGAAGVRFSPEQDRRNAHPVWQIRRI